MTRPTFDVKLEEITKDKLRELDAVKELIEEADKYLLKIKKKQLE